MAKTTPKPRKRKKAGGGKATAGGVGFQAEALAWIAVHALARKPLRGNIAGTADATPVLLKHETNAGVDDAYIELEPKGRLYLQATTDPSLAKVADFLKQVAETWLDTMTGGEGSEFTERLDRAHDSLVLVVPADAPKRLDDLEKACRQFDEATKWSDAGVDRLNAKQRAALKRAQCVVAKVYKASRGNPPSDDDLVELFAMVRVAKLGVADEGRDQDDALEVLRRDVLVDPAKARDAWNLLVTRTLDAMKRARGARRERLAETLARNGIAVKPTVGAARTGVQLVTDAVAENTEALRQVAEAIRSPGDEAVLRQHSDTELKRLLLRTRQRASFVEPAVYKREITDLATRCIAGYLCRAPTELRFRTVIFAARSNAADQATEQVARDLLADAHRIDPTGSTKLAEAMLLGLTDVDAAIRACRELDTADARSQACALLRSKKGNQEARDWVVREKLSPPDFNAAGAANVCVTALALDQFDFATDWIEKVPQHLVEESAGLLYLRGQVRLAGTVPPDQRSSVLNGLPRHLGMITFAETPAALTKRSEALADFKTLLPRLAELDVPYLTAFVRELILWLEITDPATRESAMAALAADLRNPKLVIERVRLAISFEVEFDREGLREELQRRRQAGGWTEQEASAAILLQMASRDYAEVAGFIQEYREELQRARSIGAEELIGIEIEALARSGAVAKASAKFEETRTALPEQMVLLLEAILAECDGQGDEVELARQRYEQGGGTDELRLYCGALARRKDYATLAERATDLARGTSNAEDLLRAFHALRRLGRWRAALELLQELREVSPQDGRVRLAKAEALLHVGDVDAARAILNQDFSQSTDAEVVQLDLAVSIESGDWGHIQGVVDRVKAAPEKFTPIHLAQLARVARHAGSTYAQDLMGEALKRASDDPNIYIAAYALAVDAGEEGEESWEWLRKADELSGEDGPLQRKSLKDITDMAPAWHEREERVNNEVRAGNAPLFIAARALNITVTQAALGRGLANVATPDATRRSPILAFDGSRRAVDLSKVEAVALDVSALMTLALLGLVPKVLEAFPKVVIGAGTLSLLFEERERIRFHQPSRIAKAKRLKALIDKGAIKVVEAPSDLPRGLVEEVGRDLAGLLVKAREVQGLVVQPGPLHKAGSFLEVEADFGDYAAEITDTRQVLAFLKDQAALTANIERDSTAYIHRADRGMPGAKTVTATTPLFLDELAVSYLEHTDTLVPLARIIGAVTVSKRTAEEVEALLAHEAQAEEVLARVEELRAALEAGIRKGNVIINERTPSGEEEADELRRSPTIALLQSATAYDAILVDDKVLNRMANWDVPTGRARTATTLDMLVALVKRDKLAAAQSDEALRVLRVGNFQAIGTTEEELLAMLASAPVNGDGMVETQEMKALRENLHAVAASRLLQPREEPWLLAFRLTVFRAFRTIWVDAPDTAPAKAGWLLSLLPGLADFCPIPVAPKVWANIRNLEAAETALFFSSFPIPEPHREAYQEWVTAHIVAPLLADDPDRFERAVSYYKNVIRGVVNGPGT